MLFLSSSFQGVSHSNQVGNSNQGAERSKGSIMKKKQTRREKNNNRPKKKKKTVQKFSAHHIFVLQIYSSEHTKSGQAFRAFTTTHLCFQAHLEKSFYMVLLYLPVLILATDIVHFHFTGWIITLTDREATKAFSVV